MSNPSDYRVKNRLNSDQANLSLESAATMPTVGKVVSRPDGTNRHVAALCAVGSILATSMKVKKNGTTYAIQLATPRVPLNHSWIAYGVSAVTSLAIASGPTSTKYPNGTALALYLELTGGGGGGGGGASAGATAYNGAPGYTGGGSFAQWTVGAISPAIQCTGGSGGTGGKMGSTATAAGGDGGVATITVGTAYVPRSQATSCSGGYGGGKNAAGQATPTSTQPTAWDDLSLTTISFTRSTGSGGTSPGSHGGGGGAGGSCYGLWNVAAAGGGGSGGSTGAGSAGSTGARGGGGGGGGGAYSILGSSGGGGGGGAGGNITAYIITKGSPVTITVGAGGAYRPAMSGSVAGGASAAGGAGKYTLAY